jgi:hypothetical protein
MRRRGWIAIATAAMVSAGVARPQATAPSWKVSSSPAVDLWYYGLAAVGFKGPGSMSYYNPAFVAAMRAERRSRAPGESALESGSTRFGDAFRNDTIYEALHFLPLYYADDDGSQLIASLRSLSLPGNALAEVFPSAAERKTLGDFADALDVERPYVVQSRARAKLLEGESIETLDARWEHQFLPAMAPVLRELGIKRGVLLVSPALGTEGRIVRNGDVALIAVGMPGSLEPAAPLYSAVRELCFPIVDRVHALTAAATTRLAAIELTNRAALRCGALLLDVSDAKMGAAFRRAFLDAPYDEGNLSRDFDARFPLTKTVENSLRAEIDRVMSGTRTTRR